MHVANVLRQRGEAAHTKLENAQRKSEELKEQFYSLVYETDITNFFILAR